MTEDKAKALARYLEISIDEVEPCAYCDATFEVDGAEYTVLTEAEADEAWEEALDTYLDDCVLSELDGQLAQYFDCELWKRDARYDGRGHALSGYDGEEHDLGDGFVAFRTH